MAMHETALSMNDALDAGIRYRLVENGGGVRVEEGEGEDDCFDMEQMLHLVWLALERGREICIEVRP